MRVRMVRIMRRVALWRFDVFFWYLLYGDGVLESGRGGRSLLGRSRRCIRSSCLHEEERMKLF